MTIATAAEALDFLTGSWPGERGNRYDDAVATLAKVLEGPRSAVDGEVAFRAAAREAGILSAS